MSVEQIVDVVVVSTKTEVTVTEEISNAPATAAVFLQGLRGEKGDPGSDANVVEISKTDIENLF